MHRLLTALFLLIFQLGGVAPALAQEASSTAPATDVTGEGEASGNLNCSDYYNFGSVQVNLQPNLAQTVPSATLSFSGVIINENPYPLLEGKLSVKIFKRDETTSAAGDENPVVDQFTIAEDIALPAKSNQPIAFTWKVPNNAKAGEYYAAFFFTTSERYNLMGLSFTDDVIGNQAQFSVTNDTDVEVATLQKIDTTLNGKDYSFSGLPLHFDRNDVVIVKSTIANLSGETKTIPLQWNQYAWDAQSESNRRGTKTELITLAPNETKAVSYEVRGQRESVVYITAITQDGETKSILNLRYVRDNIEETRINFPSLASFPLIANTSTTLSACAHSTNLPLVSGNILTLTLTDREGEQIHQYRYEGDISEIMAGFGETFTPTKNYNYVTLNAKLERHGVVVEQVSMTYDCNKIDPDSCLPEDDISKNLVDSLKQNKMFILLGGILILLVAWGAFYFRRRRTYITAGPLALFICLIAGSFLFTAGEAQAATLETQWSASCPAGWTATNLRDDTKNSIRHLGEENNQGAPEPQLCLRSSDPSITINSEWTTTGCSGGNSFTGVYDDAGVISSPDDWPARHNLNEDNYRPNGSSAYQWCLGATGGGATGVASRWFTLFSTVHDPACAFDETFIVGSHNFVYNLNYADFNGRNQESLCMKIVISTGSAPNAPTIVGPITGSGSTLYTFTFQATDPDNDTIRYDIDWDNNTSADESAPAAGYVASGVSQQLSHSWTVDGTYTFQARTVDSVGNRSGWTQHTITISTAPVATADLTVNGLNGPVNALFGDALNLNWTSSNSPSCTKFGAGWGSGQVVSAIGNAATVATVSDTYLLNCSGAIDSVDVFVGNQAPDVPTINGVIGGTSNGSTGANLLFSIQSIDPDNDQITYEVDWQGDGLPENNSGLVNSAFTWDQNNSWPGAGTYTIKARAIDSNGAASAWSSHTVVISSPLPPVADMEIQVNGGSWVDVDQTVNPMDTVVIRWTSTDATTCNGTNFNTGGGTSSAGVAVSTPAPNTTVIFSVDCFGPGGSGGESISVTTRQLPNLTVSQNQSPNYGAFDTTNTTYSQVTVYFLTQNLGGSDTTSLADYRFEFDFNNDGSYEYRVDRPNGIGLLTAVAGFDNDNETVAGPIPFGTHGVRITVDTGGAINETDEGDNVFTGTVSTAPPDPGLSITANPARLQNGQNTTINWTISNPYSMSCSVYGPGMVTQTFDPSSSASGNYSAGPINAKSEYTISCTTSGTTFTDTVIVETEGVIEEI